jgi:pimeloyl-ACP methyl ester carboxylesterase
MHGFPDDHRIYGKLLPRLSPRRAVAFDFVGYGRSDRRDGTHFSAENHGAEITAVLDTLGIDRAVLVGHDASGPDAVAYSIANPRRVARLVLLNTVFGNQPSLKLPEMTRLFADPQLKTLADDLVGDLNHPLWLLQRWGVQWELDANDPEGIVRNSILPQFYGDDQQPDAVASVRAWCAGLHDALDQQDALASSGTLSRLHVPVSIIWGENDRYLSPSLAAEIAALFPNPFPARRRALCATRPARHSRRAPEAMRNGLIAGRARPSRPAGLSPSSRHPRQSRTVISDGAPGCRSLNTSASQRCRLSARSRIDCSVLRMRGARRLERGALAVGVGTQDAPG